VEEKMAMKKYFVLYRIPIATVDEWRRSTDPTEMQAQSQKLMSEMTKWMEIHEKVS
jgi:hypothetical protein